MGRWNVLWPPSPPGRPTTTRPLTEEELYTAERVSSRRRGVHAVYVLEVGSHPGQSIDESFSPPELPLVEAGG